MADALNVYDLQEPYSWWLDDEADVGRAVPPIAVIDNRVDMAIYERDLLQLARVLKTLDLQLLFVATHISEVEEKKARLVKRIEHLKAWMLSICEGAGIEKAKDSLVSVWTQANPPRVEVTDESKVPKAYKRAHLNMPATEVTEDLLDYVTQTQVMKAQIIVDLKATGVVPDGITVHTDKHLRVK